MNLNQKSKYFDADFQFKNGFDSLKLIWVEHFCDYDFSNDNINCGLLNIFVKFPGSSKVLNIKYLYLIHDKISLFVFNLILLRTQ